MITIEDLYDQMYDVLKYIEIYDADSEAEEYHVYSGKLMHIPHWLCKKEIVGLDARIEVIDGIITPILAIFY